jgi:hypothetical protein
MVKHVIDITWGSSPADAKCVNRGENDTAVLKCTLKPFDAADLQGATRGIVAIELYGLPGGTVTKSLTWTLFESDDAYKDEGIVYIKLKRWMTQAAKMRVQIWKTGSQSPATDISEWVVFGNSIGLNSVEIPQIELMDIHDRLTVIEESGNGEDNCGGCCSDTADLTPYRTAADQDAIDKAQTNKIKYETTRAKAAENTLAAYINAIYTALP